MKLGRFFLCFVLHGLAIRAMEIPHQKAQLMDEIGKGALTAEQALEKIEATCKDDVALKAYVQICIARDSLSIELLSGSLARSLQKYKEDCHDAQTQEVIDVMMRKIRYPWDRLNSDPFYVAVELGKEKAIAFFKTLKLKPSSIALNNATHKESFPMVKNLVEAGAPFDGGDAEHALQHHPLQMAALKNNKALVELLAPFCDLHEKYPLWIEGKRMEANVYESIQAALELSYVRDCPASQKIYLKALELLRPYYTI